MRPHKRGGPTEFARRGERAAQLATTPGVEEPLAVLAAVLDHQQDRVRDATVLAAAALIGVDGAQRAAAGDYPLLDVTAASDAVDAGVAPAVRALQDASTLPPPLRTAAKTLEAPDARIQAVRSWLAAPTLVDATLGFWIGIAAQPILELAAVDRQPPGAQQWTAGVCPICGGAPQVAMIAEESGEFMAGSPRSLICSRCAGWWPFPRATCVACGETDSRRIGGWTAGGWAHRSHRGVRHLPRVHQDV